MPQAPAQLPPAAPAFRGVGCPSPASHLPGISGSPHCTPDAKQGRTPQPNPLWPCAWKIPRASVVVRFPRYFSLVDFLAWPGVVRLWNSHEAGGEQASLLWNWLDLSSVGCSPEVPVCGISNTSYK